jgi:ATP-dependent helicase/nuclease subunit A
VTDRRRPTDQQRKASHPGYSAWVAANAGSGKTHVLAHRVIRLMLAGADPSAILCLTYTKAAAAEMANRVHALLASWVTLEDKELSLALEDIGVEDRNRRSLREARRLFTRALETPGGLKIQTIHAFCERLLQLFPVEAGVVPGFKVADERQASDLRASAMASVLSTALSGGDQALSHCLGLISQNIQADTFQIFIARIIAKRSEHGLNPLNTQTIAAAVSALRRTIGVSPDDASAKIVDRLRAERMRYVELAGILGNTNAAKAILETANKPDSDLSAWTECFFTKERERRKIGNQTAKSKHPWIEAFINAAHEQIEKAGALECLEATEALLTIAARVLDLYENEKRHAGILDFDDLIARTRQLLTGRQSAQWVLYKLDRGLSHILVDEAQDTNAAQWDILGSLTEEFFAGEGSPHQEPRTIFVVGDRKQSIYGFQGADPDAFEVAQQDFGSRIAGLEQILEIVDLTVSFRSTDEVLKAVNSTFMENRPARTGLDGRIETKLVHQVSRKDGPGIFEIWPLIKSEDVEELDPWAPPEAIQPATSAKRLLARAIARKVRSWIGHRKLIPQNRAVRSSDIMVLLRRRDVLSESIIAELRAAGVPVAGADRLKLASNLAVLDLAALMQFATLWGDDHALACVLKSPLMPVPLDEEPLFELAHRRGLHSLWERLQASEHPACEANAAQIKAWLDLAVELRPYEFLASVVAERRAAILARLGPEADDAMNAFMALALDYETEAPPSFTGFLQWFKAGDAQIKRDMDQNAEGVRVMTVHGAKGLEANIVILPIDTNARRNNEGARLMTVDLPEFGRVPFWHLRKYPLPAAMSGLRDDLRQEDSEESHRLLYVAMTRARDELYVCGCGNSGKSGTDNWYDLVSVSPPIGIREIIEDGEVKAHRLGPDPEWIDPAPEKQGAEMRFPSWLATKIGGKPESVSRITASRGGVRNKEAAARGIVLHKLLGQLPRLPVHERRAFAERVASRNAIDSKCAASLADLVSNPNYAMVFSPGGLSEVPIAASLRDGQLSVSSRIDWLVIGDDAVIVADFKSGDPEPIEETHEYARQMALYRAALMEAYPGKSVRAALLWLEEPRLEWLDSALLERAFALIPGDNKAL